MYEDQVPQPKQKKSLLIFIILGLFLIIIIYIVITLSGGRTTFFGRASTTGVFNPTNSYVFASPLSVRSGGDKVRVTVFALDGQGRGLPNQSVSVDCKDAAVCVNARVSFEGVQPSTDNLGQAIYDLSSPVPGKFELQAVVGGSPIPQTVTINFQ
jgi:hypothetical protein